MKDNSKRYIPIITLCLLLATAGAARSEGRSVGKYGSSAPLLTPQSEGGRPMTLLSDLDLSTPEKTAVLFFKAFQVGDDDLLNATLADDPTMPRFNPNMEIKEADANLVRTEVVEIRELTERRKIGFFSDSYLEPGDTLLLIRNHYKEATKERPDKEGHETLYLKRIDGEWLVGEWVMGLWPKELKELRKNVRDRIEGDKGEYH